MGHLLEGLDDIGLKSLLLQLDALNLEALLRAGKDGALLRFHVLDTTHPQAIRRLDEQARRQYEARIVEHLPPRDVRDRRGGRLDRRAVIGGGNGDVGAMVGGADRATRK